MRLQTKMILLICSLLFVIIVVFGVYFYNMHASTVKGLLGDRALAVAKSVAEIPEIREAFDDKEPYKVIQPIVERIRHKTGAEYIVVGNRDGIRYSHPLPERIGQSMVGGDNAPVLAGKSIISEAVGSLGPSLRGKTPVQDESGNVIGIVSVGFLQHDIAELYSPDRNKIILLSSIALTIGVFGALIIALNVKRSIFGLEPRQIARLYREQQAVLESIREGIIAVNQQGTVTTANQTAVKMLDLPHGQVPVGSKIVDILPFSRMMDVVQTGRAEYDREMIFGDHIAIVNRVPVFDRGQVIGAVATFRYKSELSKVTAELSQVKRYAESLRAQTHEYSNKLHTISGLIQLESYQEAIELITRESDVHQNLVQFIMKEVPDPMIGGLLIGKFNRANELRVKLTIDPHSTFADLPPALDRNHIVTILGNLIDNAMEAVLASESAEKRIHVFLTDLSDDLILEVEDTGSGVPEADVERIFEVGYSTKPNKEHRGFGLALVMKAVQQLGGYVTFEPNDPTGSIFTVAIPKEVTATRERTDH
ncbi:MAG: sensor histidine kinase [Tumebacillaceae bacterium]